MKKSRIDIAKADLIDLKRFCKCQGCADSTCVSCSTIRSVINLFDALDDKMMKICVDHRNALDLVIEKYRETNVQLKDSLKNIQELVDATDFPIEQKIATHEYIGELNDALIAIRKITKTTLDQKD